MHVIYRDLYRTARYVYITGIRGLQILRLSWETFVQEFNICISLLKSNDKCVPYCKDIGGEMERCIQALGLDKQELEQE